MYGVCVFECFEVNNEDAEAFQGYNTRAWSGVREVNASTGLDGTLNGKSHSARRDQYFISLAKDNLDYIFDGPFVSLLTLQVLSSWI